jgi:hypothetical protein
MKPSFFSCAGALAASGGSIENPAAAVNAYRQLRRTANNRNTGAPKCRPRKSQSALST